MRRGSRPIQKIKDQVTDLDKKTRTMSGLLNKIHSTPANQRTFHNIMRVRPHLTRRFIATVPPLLDQVKPVLASCKNTNAALAALIPPSQFWRFKEMWTNSLRNAVFAATMVGYLENGTLLTLPQVRDVLGSASTFYIAYPRIPILYLASQTRVERQVCSRS